LIAVRPGEQTPGPAIHGGHLLVEHTASRWRGIITNPYARTFGPRHRGSSTEAGSARQIALRVRREEEQRLIR
jgi:hypothetical protein